MYVLPRADHPPGDAGGVRQGQPDARPRGQAEGPRARHAAVLSGLRGRRRAAGSHALPHRRSPEGAAAITPECRTARMNAHRVVCRYRNQEQEHTLEAEVRKEKSDLSDVTGEHMHSDQNGMGDVHYQANSPSSLPELHAKITKPKVPSISLLFFTLRFTQLCCSSRGTPNGGTPASSYRLHLGTCTAKGITSLDTFFQSCRRGLCLSPVIPHHSIAHHLWIIRCNKLRVHIIPVDLRWGVTEEDTQQALEICLAEIDNCRPFFVGLLGRRYGRALQTGHCLFITRLRLVLAGMGGAPMNM